MQQQKSNNARPVYGSGDENESIKSICRRWGEGGPLKVLLDCSAHLTFLAGVLFPLRADAASSTLTRICRNPCACMKKRPGAVSVSVERRVSQGYSDPSLLLCSPPVPNALGSRGRWTAGRCRARPWTASSPWCPRASAAPAASPTPARPTPSATTSPRRARTSTASPASVAPPGSNMAPSAPSASAR